MVPGRSVAQVALKYKIRRQALRLGAVFRAGHEYREILCLGIAKELIIGALSRVSDWSQLVYVPLFSTHGTSFYSSASHISAWKDSRDLS